MTDDMKIQICRDDFYLMMRNAVNQAGGADNVDKWKKMKFEELVDTMAQNGIRMVHMPERHMDSVKIEWKAKPVEGKKQLLKDHKSTGYTIVDGVKIWADDNEK